MPEQHYRVSNHAIGQFMTRSGLQGSITMAEREIRKLVRIGKHMVPLPGEKSLGKARNMVLAYDIRVVVSASWAFIFKDDNNIAVLMTCYPTGQSKWEGVEYLDESAQEAKTGSS